MALIPPLFALSALVVCGIAVLMVSARRHLVAVFLAAAGLILVALGLLLELLRAQDLADAMHDDIMCLIARSGCDLGGARGFAGLGQWVYDTPFILGSSLLLMATIVFFLSSFLRKRKEQVGEDQQAGPFTTTVR